jgi:hypothetical protein
MCNWWIARSARKLWRRLVCGFLLLLLEPFGPGRHDAVHARLGDGLAEIVAKVPGDGDEGTAHGGSAIIRRDDVRKHFAYGANAFGRTPGVFLSRHGLGETRVALLVGDFFQELGAEA